MDMDVLCSKIADFDAWLSLASEVESLFGPMTDAPDFQDSLKQAICSDTAFCIRSEPNRGNKGLIDCNTLSEARYDKAPPTKTTSGFPFCTDTLLQEH